MCISLSANNWGQCDNETKAVGCGPQEIYRNCADISVLPGAGIRGSAGFNPRPRVPKSMKKYSKDYFKHMHSPYPHKRRL
ncbi:chitin-binding type-4 domain-containing protein [Caerostris extrusa]|uniref:Chitin-binding type-4 domain-containing protein n=1 Tax=Caerostris extrusa TaxID=172846 RepID=A0AAV4XAQ7_CAEEX|nr:chitin-binding type-4 domain-containing protein [Caerostris extrusa]